MYKICILNENISYICFISPHQMPRNSLNNLKLRINISYLHLVVGEYAKNMSPG